MTTVTWCRSVAAVLAIGVFGFLSCNASGQGVARPASKADGKSGESLRDTSRHLRITGIEWRGANASVREPQYEYRDGKRATSGKNTPQWLVITTTYDTGTNWIDSLSVTYHVLLPAEQGAARNDGQFLLCESTVVYLDVKGELGHKSTMYLRPNTIERYGEPVAVGVEISFGGERVSKCDFAPACSLTKEARQSGKWWEAIRGSRRVVSKDGCLLNRAQTPFALTDFSDEEYLDRAASR
jgi:hypothetical protein